MDSSLGFRGSTTRFSTQAGRPRAGTRLKLLSKQTEILRYSVSEPEHLEPDRKQATGNKQSSGRSK